MTTQPDFRFLVESDIPAVLRLFQRAFVGRRLSEAYYRWQFIDNPLLPFSSVVAEQDGSIVAHAGYTARRALFESRTGILFIKQTSMSDPRVRGSGAYSRLLTWAHEHLAQRQGELILSYPNGENHPVQILRPDYLDICEIPCLVRPPFGKSAEAHALDLPFLSAASYGFVNEVSELGTATTSASLCGLVRSAEYLCWRYAKHPENKYHVCEQRTAGCLRSLLICKLYPGDRPTRIMVVEWLSAPDDSDAAEVFAPLEEYADRHGLAICAWQNVFQRQRRKVLERRGFRVDMPITYFGAFALARHWLQPVWGDYRNWHIAMGDVDVF